HLEVRLGKYAIPGNLLSVHFEDSGAFILQVRVGILTIDVENNLSYREFRQSTLKQWLQIFIESLNFSLLQFIRSFLTHLDCGLDHLLHRIRLTCARHTKERCSLAQEILGAYIHRNIIFLLLESAT